MKTNYKKFISNFEKGEINNNFFVFNESFLNFDVSKFKSNNFYEINEIDLSDNSNLIQKKINEISLLGRDFLIIKNADLLNKNMDIIGPYLNSNERFFFLIFNKKITSKKINNFLEKNNFLEIEDVENSVLELFFNKELKLDLSKNFISSIEKSNNINKIKNESLKIVNSPHFNKKYAEKILKNSFINSKEENIFLFTNKLLNNDKKSAIKMLEKSLSDGIEVNQFIKITIFQIKNILQVLFAISKNISGNKISEITNLKPFQIKQIYKFINSYDDKEELKNKIFKFYIDLIEFNYKENSSYDNSNIELIFKYLILNL